MEWIQAAIEKTNGKWDLPPVRSMKDHITSSHILKEITSIQTRLTSIQPLFILRQATNLTGCNIALTIDTMAINLTTSSLPCDHKCPVTKNEKLKDLLTKGAKHRNNFPEANYKWPITTPSMGWKTATMERPLAWQTFMARRLTMELKHLMTQPRRFMDNKSATPPNSSPHLVKEKHIRTSRSKGKCTGELTKRSSPLKSRLKSITKKLSM